MVGIGCDPELSLRLGLGGGGCGGEDCSSSASCSAKSIKVEGSRLAPEKQITIFYNGQICVCDVTEIQARAIISMAKREVEDKENENNKHDFQQLQFPYKLQHRGLNPELLNQQLSMKRSLQRFLQKRKTRIAAVSPYNHRHQCLSSFMS
ncbi:protein TIFY 5A-like [Typha angustifolia]|uniref:protein TIFY 5A-like n=1 Tax=Typha angustifolia TaxID=59011 RepID=UPI003C2B9A0D